ncbi:MarR family transcriptional regulator [Nocardioides sp. 616]|uniref:MarR family winged helix-turn-helix transcriptional regulator n=1 Tax=Nocardioides sp. 616 TaxID=2268090 RepID=UPI000CE50B80|nr:MarR family transcriptional regulator [Nocardioides sp. 616]
MSSEVGPAIRDDTLGALEREVAVLIRRARRAIGHRARLVHPDLHPAAYLMLALLLEQGPLRPSEVAEVFDLDKGAVSRQVQQLVDLGLVSRSPDPADGRASIIETTPLARKAMAEVVDERRARLKSRLDEWDDRALSEFVESLGRYNSALEG